MIERRNFTTFNVFGYLVLLAAIPAILQNMWEVYWVTITKGPQMIGFVLAHANPDSAMIRLFRYSLYASFIFSLIGIISIGRLLATGETDRHQKLFSWLFLVFSAHGLCSSLYAYWSPLFDRNTTP